MGHRLGQLDHLDGASPIGKPADEAAFFQCGNEAMDAGLRTQVERILHLIEGWRYAGFLQAFVDEAQQFELFSSQHLASPIAAGLKRLAETNHEQTLYVRYVFRNHLIWRERVKETPRACAPQRCTWRAGAAR